MKKHLQNFSKIIQCKTDFSVEKHNNFKEFKKLHNVLEQSYPLIHKKFSREIVSDASLVYRLEGTDKSLKPILLVAHQDVFPADESLDQWEHSPYSGDLADGHIWGRGTLDMKHTLTAIFEAIESLLQGGFVPKRSIYIASSHNEKIMSQTGAKAIAEKFTQEKINFDCILDEGSFVFSKLVPGVKKPLAAVGIAEKDRYFYKLSIKVPYSGHGSEDGKETAIEVMGDVINKINSFKFPAKITPIVSRSFNEVSKYAPFYLKNFLKSNYLLLSLLRAMKITESSVRSILEFKQAQSGEEESISMYEGKIIVSVRAIPGDTKEKIKEMLGGLIDDSRIKINLIKSEEVSDKVSSTKSSGYKNLAKTIEKIFPSAVVFPIFFPAMTDSRNFVKLSDSIYRFTPIVSDESFTNLAHGINERISVENFERMIDFFKHFVGQYDKN